MSRTLNRLTALEVTKAYKKQMLLDGGGLYLQVTSSSAKSWIFRFQLHGKERQMGLGPYPSISLVDARAQASDCRRCLLKGLDPIKDRDIGRTKATGTSFRLMAERLISTKSPEWKNAKHRQQWCNTLAVYAYPILGEIDVAAITTEDVLRVLEPIWTRIPVTASRLRGRIERVLNVAKTLDQRSGENPARWRGHLENLLPRRTRMAEAHHAALPFAELGDFMTRLRIRGGSAARALEFQILTAVRPSEARLATWSEINFEGRIWKIPASRMKGGKEHRVPLSQAALMLLRGQNPANGDQLIFPGNELRLRPEPRLQLSHDISRTYALSDMAVQQLLRRMGFGHITAHGFRSVFRDWIAEFTDYSGELGELALAHKIPNKVEAAYRRGDQLEKRRSVMEEWAVQCSISVNKPMLVA